jgi:hypothetical protein
MPLIAVINQSTLVTNAEVELMCQATQLQMERMVAPAWQVQSPTITFYPDQKDVPGYAWIFSIIDNDDSVPGALGYHTLNTNGQVQAFIMAQPVLQSSPPGVVLFDPSNPNNYSVSGCFSHEAIEALMDRFCDVYFVNGETMYAYEMCDPCEDRNIVINVNGQSVFVSDFIFPAWGNPNNITGPFDACKALSKPFTLTSGGYYVTGTSPSSLQQVFGDTMPAFRRQMKQSQFSRGARRVHNSNILYKTVYDESTANMGLLARFVAWFKTLFTS